MSAEYSNLEVFKLIVNNVKDVNAPSNKNIINLIKRTNERTLAQSKIEYLFDRGYIFDNMNLQILPLLSFSENLDNPVLVNTLATINPNAPIYGRKDVMLSKMISEGANDETVMAILPYFDAANVSSTATASLLIRSIYSKRIQYSTTITALIDSGLDVNISNYGSYSILMTGISSINKVENEEEFEILKNKIAALIDAGADVSYVDNQGQSALTILEKLDTKKEYKQKIRAMLE
ncbi:hypothetical protein [Vibrio ziniensis]|uniref:Uncharacterized protein n=1 Tax=Vibrio ziniensis TaxID=2711221 RepID=A0A6G7CP44_9VIBR|nr:hypothetical protein [Vibrio ziniensis]QIH43875.1 hypothetical protein G5S32_18005 [Vibrio ziniensis]